VRQVAYPERTPGGDIGEDVDAMHDAGVVPRARTNEGQRARGAQARADEAHERARGAQARADEAHERALAAQARADEAHRRAAAAREAANRATTEYARGSHRWAADFHAGLARSHEAVARAAGSRELEAN